MAGSVRKRHTECPCKKAEDGVDLTYSFNSVRLALQSQNRSSHCCAKYASRCTTASGLYRSSPLMMEEIASGRSDGSSPLMLGREDVVEVGVVEGGNEVGLVVDFFDVAGQIFAMPFFCEQHR